MTSRSVALTLAFAFLTPGVATATPLVGAPVGSPLRLLNADLTARRSGPVLPRLTVATVLSPDRRRFAALTRRRIVVFDRRSGRRIAALPAHGAIAALWPMRHRLVTFGFDAAGGEELRAVQVATGRITRRVRLAERLDAEISGGRVRVLQRTRAGLALDVFAADGRRLRRYRFPLPAGVTPSLMGGSLRDGMVLVSTTTGAVAPYRHDLVPLGGAAHPIGLTGAVYRFVTPGIVADAEGNLASLDRRALTVSREVTDAPSDWLTPVAGGVAVGLGRLLYDRHLALVAAHPSAPAAASAPVASGARLYALTVRCTVAGRADGAIGVGARTGSVVARRKGPFAIGRLGGPVARPAEDACD
ncbi:MAG TPA: hypothetical protein VFX51_24495 [Solirubrobacteraceae bacterium]|nr:hypothetical protein [Solirubrobacteraceae bacterium]